MKNLNVVVNDRMVRVEFLASDKDDWVFNDEFRYFSSWKQLCWHGKIYADSDFNFVESIGWFDPPQTKISAAQRFTQVYGVSPTIVKDRINSAMYKAFGLNKYVMFCLFDRPGDITTEYQRIVRNFQQRKEEADQAVHDGLPHIVPLIVATRLSPHDLKTLVGKGAWKRLAANSFSRNKMLCHKLMQATRGEAYNQEFVGDLLALLNQFPTTVLSAVSPHSHIQTIETMYHHYRKWDGTLKAFVTKLHENFYNITINDTLVMCHRFGRPFNPRWSEKRIQEEHDACNSLLLQETYSPECFLHLQNPHEVTHAEYKVELLRSPYEIAMEGSLMRHCVASYVDRVGLGVYLIYKLTCEGSHVGTIGLITAYGVRIDQIQGPRNSQIEVPDELKHKLLAEAQRFCKEPTHVDLYPVGENFFI